MRTDSMAVILNAKAVKHLGFSDAESAIGEKINPGSNWELDIVGVIENYHQASVKEELDPVIFFYSPNQGAYYSLKAQTSNYTALLESLDTKWNQVYPDNPLDFFFLDQKFAQQYEAEKRFSSIFLAFSILAIIVACLGLFGLISFTVEQSKKEIGIRKVLGASSSHVVMLLIKDYTKLIIVAIALAFPLSYYLMDQWLQSFAYRTEIGVGVFILTAVLIMMISFFTVSAKSYQAASINPANVLRND